MTIVEPTRSSGQDRNAWDESHLNLPDHNVGLSGHAYQLMRTPGYLIRNGCSDSERSGPRSAAPAVNDSVLFLRVGRAHYSRGDNAGRLGYCGIVDD
jgi:hypothetical protein